MDIEELIPKVKESAKEVFKELGGGHSESVIEASLEIELVSRGIGPIIRQVPCPIYYKNHPVGYGFLDIVIGDLLVVELKAQSGIAVKDEYQIRKYLNSLCIEDGLLINFGLDKVTARRVQLDEAQKEKCDG